MGSRLALCHHYLSEGNKITKVLFYCHVAHSTWYKHVNNLKNAREDQRQFNPGRPLAGFCYHVNGSKVSDKKIIQRLIALRERDFLSNGGGYKKLKHYLYRWHGIIINNKKVYRLCLLAGILLPKKKKPKKIRNICQNKVISKPHELWEFDIKYGYIHKEEKFFFILAYIDVYSRKVIYHYAGLCCKSHNLVATLSLALKQEMISEDDLLTVRSDNGPQMTSHQFSDYLASLQLNIEHEFIPPATPNKNAHIESFFSILEIEFLQANYFSSMKEVYVKLNAFVTFYNKERVHGSLYYKTPEEIMKSYRGGSLEKVKKLNV